MKPCKHYTFDKPNAIYLGWYMVRAGGELRVMDMYFLDKVIPDIVILYKEYCSPIRFRSSSKTSSWMKEAIRRTESLGYSLKSPDCSNFGYNK